MKRFWLLGVCLLALVPCLRAQDETKFEAGLFADYFRAGTTGTNMFGIGGRVGAEVLPHLQIEGEMAYDFNRAFVDGFTETTGGSESYLTSGVKTLHGLIGPRYGVEHGRFRPFVEAKIGFVNFEFNNLPVGFNSFSNQVQNLRLQNVNAAVLLGGGVEATIAGPVGVRVDVGDEIYFNNGAQHGLKATFGPVVRF
jgi:hypothetical protein